MKQHITIKQLQELVGKQHEALYKWCRKKGYLTNFSNPLFSIGQLFEFLNEKCPNKVIIYQNPKGGSAIDIRWQGELVDYLWKLTKKK